jgi:hypothetical protein
MTAEKLVQKCGCNACEEFLPENARYGSRDRVFCSQMCENHAGGELWRAEADHAREG